MILKQLASEVPECVFKGGTSLSKCHRIIDRFSEDIDIGFSNPLTQGKRKKLKDNVIAGISERLNMPIIDWENAKSRRDYNCYTFDYSPVTRFVKESLIPGVKLEVVLSSVAFPTTQLDVTSYIYEYLSKENMDIVEEYGLEPFSMNVQSLERTFADKVFAICDYYLQEKTARNSRHIYDLYMLLPKIKMDSEFRNLIHEIREQRMKMPYCPSAEPGINISELLKKIVEEEVYRSDYERITAYFQNKPLPYDTAIEAVEKIIREDVF